MAPRGCRGVRGLLKVSGCIEGLAGSVAFRGQKDIGGIRGIVSS